MIKRFVCFEIYGIDSFDNVDLIIFNFYFTRQSWKPGLICSLLPRREAPFSHQKVSSTVFNM